MCLMRRHCSISVLTCPLYRMCRLAIRVAPRVLAVTGSFMAAGRRPRKLER